MVVEIGVSGSRDGLSEKQREWAEEAIDWAIMQDPNTRLHHGDCVGADAELHDLFTKVGLHVLIYPPLDSKHRACCQSPTIYPVKPYRERNTNIVRAADILWAFPEGPEDSYVRSGTWMTVRIARRLKVPYIVVMP